MLVENFVARKVSIELSFYIRLGRRDAAPSVLHPPTNKPEPSKVSPQTSNLNPLPLTLIPQPSTLTPQPSTLNTQHSTLNTQPQRRFTRHGIKLVGCTGYEPCKVSNLPKP